MSLRQKARDFFINPPKWSAIRNIGGSNFSKISLSIPIVGYLIVFNKNIFGSLALFDGLSKSNHWYQLNYESKLILLYIGSVVFAAATFFYKVLCPPVIQKNGSEREYCSGETLLMTKERINIIISEYKALLSTGQRLDSLPELALPYVNLIGSEIVDVPEDALGSDGSRLKNDGFIGANKHSIQNILSGVYHAEDYSSPITRSSINVAYKISFLLMAIPSLESTIRVFFYIFNE